jgi:hypothetical protein
VEAVVLARETLGMFDSLDVLVKFAGNGLPLEVLAKVWNTLANG